MCFGYWITAALFTTNIITDFVLEARGGTITATEAETIYDPTFVAVRSAGMRSCDKMSCNRPGSFGVALVDSQGVRLPGGIPLSKASDEADPGARHRVVRDPRGRVPVREPDEIHPVIDSVVTLLPLVFFYGVAWYSFAQRRVVAGARIELTWGDEDSEEDETG